MYCRMLSIWCTRCTWVPGSADTSVSLLDLPLSNSPSPFFFFQAEDGIRGIGVTGVQTCALPISGCRRSRSACRGSATRSCERANTTRVLRHPTWATSTPAREMQIGEDNPPTSVRTASAFPRSEERRVGKEGGGAGSREHEEENDG